MKSLEKETWQEVIFGFCLVFIALAICSGIWFYSRVSKIRLCRKAQVILMSLWAMTLLFIFVQVF